MSETKFTKGEWGALPIEEDKEYIRIRGATLGGRYKIANVIDLKDHHSDAKWCEREREESLANAHLIKAAPKMYKFIESLQLSVADSIKRDELLKEARGERED